MSTVTNNATTTKADAKKIKAAYKKEQAQKNANLLLDAAIDKAQTKLTTINFEMFASKVANVADKIKQQKSTLYNYPIEFTAIQINGDEGKKFRSKLRKKLENFCNNISVNYKMQRSEILLENIASFDLFYKENYKTNDYSINSITHTKDEKNAYISTTLDIIKLVKQA